MTYFDYERTMLALLENKLNEYRLRPLNLGGVASSGGGAGGAGGYVGYLPQTRVAYDYTELASLYTPSGADLVDNLNHIRYRLNVLEAVAGFSGATFGNLAVYDDNGFVSDNVTELDFLGDSFTIANPDPGKITISLGNSGGISNTQITVQRPDGTYGMFPATNQGLQDAIDSCIGQVETGLKYFYLPDNINGTPFSNATFEFPHYSVIIGGIGFGGVDSQPILSATKFDYCTVKLYYAIMKNVWVSQETSGTDDAIAVNAQFTNSYLENCRLEAYNTDNDDHAFALYLGGATTSRNCTFYNWGQGSPFGTSYGWDTSPGGRTYNCVFDVNYISKIDTNGSNDAKVGGDASVFDTTVVPQYHARDINEAIYNYHVPLSTSDSQMLRGIGGSWTLADVYSTADISNPPTSGQLNSIFGLPSELKGGFIGIINDNSLGSNVYLVSTTASGWYYTSLTKAL